MAGTTNNDDYPDTYFPEIRYKEQQSKDSFYHWEHIFCRYGPGSTIGVDKGGDVMPRETASGELRERKYEFDWEVRRRTARERMAAQVNGLRSRSYSDSPLRNLVDIDDYEEPHTVDTPEAPSLEWSQLTPSEIDDDSRGRIAEIVEVEESPKTVGTPVAPISTWSQLTPPGRTSNWADDDDMDDEEYFGFKTSTTPVRAEPASTQSSQAAERKATPSPSETSPSATTSTIPPTSDTPTIPDRPDSDPTTLITILESRIHDLQLELDTTQSILLTTELSLSAARKHYRAALSAQETSHQTTLAALAEADHETEKYRLSAQRFNEEFVAAKNAKIEVEKRLAATTKMLEEEIERSEKYRKQRNHQEDKYLQAKAMVESSRQLRREAERKLGEADAEKKLREAELETKLQEAMSKLEILRAETKQHLEAEAERKVREAETEKKLLEAERKLAEVEEKEKARVAVEDERKRQRDTELEQKEADIAAKPIRSELGLAMERVKELAAKQRAIIAQRPEPIVPVPRWTRPVWSDEQRAYFLTIGHTITE